MYLEFYGLTSKPFELLPDPRFLYVSRGHDLALTRLEDGIATHKPFIVLSGEVGTGKTTLLNFLLKKISDDANMAMIVNPDLVPQEFLELVLRRFRGNDSLQQGTPPFEDLHSFLMDQHVLGRRSILIVDEAQNIPKETLEQVRLLTNLQTESVNLLQVILSGQPQLKERLKTPELSELAQRISVHYHLYPLEESETDRYIQHRLRVAGYSGHGPLFSPEAVQRIHQYTNGVPRLINSICDTALIYGFSEDAHVLGVDIVQKVIRDRDVQIGGDGDVPVGFSTATGLFKQVEATAQSVGRSDTGDSVVEIPEARHSPGIDSGPQSRRVSPRQNGQIGEGGDGNVPLHKKADLIAHHYRKLWSLNQDNRKRLATLVSNFRLLWSHYEQLRKEHATLITQGRMLKKQLRAKDERILSLQNALHELLNQNRALKKNLEKGAVHLEDDPDKLDLFTDNTGVLLE